MIYSARLLSSSIGVMFSVLVLIPVASGQDSSWVGHYPYGCVPDEALHDPWVKKDKPTPLRCSGANFFRAQFDTLAYFKNAQFHTLAYFNEAHFREEADFSRASFEDWVDFNRVRFDGRVNFLGANFGPRATFNDTRYYKQAIFASARFDSLANFEHAQFHSQVYFGGTEFVKRVSFQDASFDSLVSFGGTTFRSKAYFRGALFNDGAKADFSRATLHDTLFIGNRYSDSVQRFDFRRVYFLAAGHDLRQTDSVEVSYPGAAIVLAGPVEFDMQRAKLDFVHLAAKLAYFEKEDIITHLKEKSFSEDEAAQFELDYLLARSVMHQPPMGIFEEYPWYHPVLWKNYAYFYLMGFGYRPFRIFLWAGLMILLFALYYRLRMPHEIYAFVQGKDKEPAQSSQTPQAYAEPPTWNITIGRFKLGRVVPETPQAAHIGARKMNKPSSKLSAPNPWIHCLYFSVMVFFTFRLKQKILTFFNIHERRFIVFQWTLGFAVYLFFILGAKSGSILHQLKTLFVG